jgi:hypothetical protein
MFRLLRQGRRGVRKRWRLIFGGDGDREAVGLREGAHLAEIFRHYGVEIAVAV